MDKELRYMPTTEVRVAADGKKIEGYAAVFNVPAQLPGFVEVMRQGAFTRSLRNNADVVCLWNHSVNHPLGRTTSGTLRLSQDSKGLHYECDLPNTSYAKDVHELIRARTVSGCSFAFKIPNADAQKWSEGRAADGTHFIQRDITDVDLLDVSPVTNPCYSGTSVDARSVAQAPAELRSAVDSKNAGRIVVPTLEPDIEEKFRRLGLLRLALMD
jgi:HK97 family phage prohead protease